MTTFIHNLSEFSVDPKSIVEFAEKLASINELEMDHMVMLRTMPVYGEVNIAELDPNIAEQLEHEQQQQQQQHGIALRRDESDNDTQNENESESEEENTPIGEFEPVQNEAQREE